MAQLDLLERKRNLLNEYQEELHTLTSGLNISIYSVNGRLAKLENVPDVIFSISDADLVTTDILNERIYLLNELSKTIGQRSEDYSHNVWCNSSVRYLSNALRHEIDSNVAIAVPIMKELAEQHASICFQLGIDLEPSLMGFKNLIAILSFVAKSPFVPIEWMMDHEINDLLDKANVYKGQSERIVKITNELKGKFRDDFFYCDAAKSKDQLSSLMIQLKPRIKGKDNNWIAHHVNEINGEIVLISSQINLLFEKAANLASKLDIFTPNTIDQVVLFIKTLSFASSFIPFSSLDIAF